MCIVQERILKNEQKSSIGVCEAEPGNARTQKLQWSLLGSSVPNGLNVPRGSHWKTTTTTTLYSLTVAVCLIIFLSSSLSFSFNGILYTVLGFKTALRLLKINVFFF